MSGSRCCNKWNEREIETCILMEACRQSSRMQMFEVSWLPPFLLMNLKSDNAISYKYNYKKSEVN
jgi:hypothetical protein